MYFHFIKKLSTVTLLLLISGNVFANSSFSALEKTSGGRIGISAINTANNQKITYRAQERFPFDCTAKMMGVAAVLKQSMTDPKLLQEKLHYTKQDLIEWSPITKKHITSGMTIEQLCKAAITISDNTAMNVLLKKFGGPSFINNFARSIGDTTFNLQSFWPNEAKWRWGDTANTTTPLAMQKSLQKIALGHVLANPQRTLLITFLTENKTGDARIRAGVPKGWTVADKTGTNFYDGAAGDIAVIWPPHQKPIVLAVYYKKNKLDAKKREDMIAAATRIALNTFAQNDQQLKKSMH